MAGATTLSELASAIGVRTEEASVVAELKAGSEEAFYWLIAHYNQPVYSLIYRILDDPSDGGLDASPDVAAVQVDLLRDEREVTLGIGVALNQSAGLAEMPLELRQIVNDTVVREQAIVLAERVRVRNGQPARRSVTDV